MATATPLATPQTADAPRRAAPQGRGRAFHWVRPTLCDWCYAREMLLPMSIGLLVLMLVLAGNFVYWAINSIVNNGLSAAPVLRLFLLAAPGFAVQGVPAGVILAVCLVLNRAVRDNEVIALRVGGASMPRIIAPFLVMALLASAADWLVVEKIAPRTNDLAEKLLLRMLSRSGVPLLENDMYFRAGPYYFYVEAVDKEQGVLHHVMIYERGSGNFDAFNATAAFPVVMIAASAQEEPKGSNQWVLRKVVQHAYDEQGRQTLEARYDRWTINVGHEISTYWDEQKQPFSMSGDELWGKIQDLSKSNFDQGKLKEWRVDYYRRYALPFACFVMALLAAPLALRYARHGSFAGLVLAFALAFVWQGLDGWFRALGIHGDLSPVVAAWLTNALFLVAGGALLWRER